MHFVDECQLRLLAGKGGDGAIAFRREKFVPLGGPAGGDGGRGGDVVFVADGGLGTLHDLKHLRVVRATNGENGGGKDMYGRGGADAEVRVPPGTVVTDAQTGELLVELTEPNQRFVIAHGGGGGRGNKHFATPVERAPRRAELGEPGEQRTVNLELKVMADVGLLGFPNVGKSTFIRCVSRARPRVADYPFTTLEPHLGVVHYGDTSRGLGQTFVVADIPGLVPGASQGVGLGARFLRHVERTRVLLHLVTLSHEEGRDPVDDYQVIRRELEQFDPALCSRPEIVALSKGDLPEVTEAYADLKPRFAALGIELLLLSSATRIGVQDAISKMVYSLSTSRSDGG